MPAPRSLLLVAGILVLRAVQAQPTEVEDYSYPNDGEDYDYEEGEEDDGSQEGFVASGAKVVIQSGKVHQVVAEDHLIQLPCLVDNPDNIPIMWFHSTRAGGMSPLAIGEKVLKETREGATVKVDRTGSTLRIPQAKSSDAGEYVCEVATGSDDKPSVVHTVTVTAAPAGEVRTPGESAGQQAAVVGSGARVVAVGAYIAVIAIAGLLV